MGCGQRFHGVGPRSHLGRGDGGLPEMGRAPSGEARAAEDRRPVPGHVGLTETGVDGPALCAPAPRPDHGLARLSRQLPWVFASSIHVWQVFSDSPTTLPCLSSIISLSLAAFRCRNSLIESTPISLSIAACLGPMPLSSARSFSTATTVVPSFGSFRRQHARHGRWPPVVIR